VHSRKLSATLGGSISTRPGVQKITLKTCAFVDINNTLASNATIPTALGGSTTTSPLIVIVVLRQQLDYVIVDYAASTTSHPIKAKFSSSKSQLSFTFAASDPRGLRHKKSSCISLTSKKIAKALVAGVPCRILDNLVYSRRNSTNSWQGTNLGCQANEKA
jgi:hypothetical protein